MVKHIIAQSTTAQTADQISTTVLDAIKWIDLSWKVVTELTIQNAFRTAGFVQFSPSSSIDNDIIVEGDLEPNGSNDPLQQLDSLLSLIKIGGQHLTAAEFVDIDSCIPAYNEWDDDVHLKDLIEVS